MEQMGLLHLYYGDGKKKTKTKTSRNLFSK